jgi:hypothetical protein
MTLTPVPYVLQNSSHPASLFRQATSSLIAPAGGIVQPQDFQVTQNGTPNMSVNVGAGRIWVPSTYTATVNPGGGAYYPGGLYYAENDASVNLPISASNPTNPRLDQIIVQVQDTAYAGSTNSAQLAVLTGTATAGASLANLVGLASMPASSLLLGYVLVPANATSIVTADIANEAAPYAASGREWTYAAFTATVTVGSTTESSANTVVTAPTFTPDGGPVVVEFFSPAVYAPAVQGGAITFCLFEGSTEIARLGTVTNPVGGVADASTPVCCHYRFTPTSAAHTYTVSAFVSSIAGTPTVVGGTGGTASNPPGFVRITKV